MLLGHGLLLGDLGGGGLVQRVAEVTLAHPHSCAAILGRRCVGMGSGGPWG